MKTRRTARAILFDPTNRVLLFEFLVPEGYLAGTSHFWATPGGEIEPGEDVIEAVAREVREETGIVNFQIGPELWYGSNQITFKGQAIKTIERFFCVRSETAELGATNWTDVEKQVMRSYRWWTVPELIGAKVTIFPPRIGYLVEQFIAHGTSGRQEIPL